MSEKILEALAALNPEDESHWTAQGLPAIAVVRDLAKNQDITRFDVEKAAPGFNLQVARGLNPDKEMPLAEAAEAVEPSREEAHKLLKQGIDDLRAVERKHVAEAERQKKLAAEAVAAIDRARAEFDEKYPPLSPAERHKAWVKNNQKQRAERAAYLKAAQAVINGHHKSPLYQALAEKRGFGTQRPNYLPGK